jgi:hypothetical protein
MKLELSLMVLWFALALPVIADEALTPLRTDTPPVIDGKLDDPVWQTAPRVTGFKTFVPDFGIEMADQTVVYFAYDRENLYFAFRCFDREPDKIKSSMSRRDNIRPDDWICINLDSFNDQQALYGFYVNPAGIQDDSRFASGREDFGVDLIWHSAGKIDEKGYTIEARIPFKSIRFANKETVEMGVIFERRVSRRNEQGTYPPLKPERGFFFLTQMMPIRMHDVKHYKLFELLPAVTHSQKSLRQAGRLVSAGKENDFSLTTKYGMTSDLIFDGTYNPDFSQVEADAGQVDVNLRFNLFFSEKRPFFLEGSENFNFAGSSFSDPLAAIVHTRTIVDPIAGVKLSGKIGRKNFLAVIEALDELPNIGAARDSTGKYAHASILRYKRALSGDGYIGVFFTGRELKNGFNRVFGPDGQIRINESSILGYNFFLSSDKAGAAAAAQTGHTAGLDYVYNTRNLDVSAGVQDLSNDFDTKTGFVTRTGIAMVRASITPKFYPKSGFIRRIDPAFFSAQIKDRPSELYETSNSFSLRFVLKRNASISFSANYSTEIFLGEKFKTSGVSVSGSSQIVKQLSFSFSSRYGKTIRFSSDPFQGKGSNASASVTYQPSEKLNANLSFRYSNLFRDSNSEKIFDVKIWRGRLTYQLNRFLFFRGIVELNTFRQRLLTDFLASFTYIPGTVMHLGYGSLYEKNRFDGDVLVSGNRFVETQRGIFAKASYLWRL